MIFYRSAIEDFRGGEGGGGVLKYLFFQKKK